MALGIGKATLLSFAVLIVIVVLVSQPSLAATVQVGTCLTGPPHYSTIQSAVNASAPGTMIRVCPGNYPEQVTINGKSLTLAGVELGTGSTPVVTSPTGGIVANTSGLGGGGAVGAQILVQNATGVTITGLTVDGSNNLLSSCTLDLMGIYFQNASGIINFAVTRNQNLGAGSECQSGEGIFAQSGYGFGGASTVVIENSHVYGYQKNGISADGNTLTVTISANDVLGQGPTPFVAQNGIQITDGTRGTVLGNTVANDVYTGSSFSATGILVYAASGLSVNNNNVANTQGIAVFSGGSDGNADQTTIISNHVLDTDTYDAIDACSSGNTIVANAVFGSPAGGIHIDDSCVESNSGPSGNNNTVTNNRVNDVCAGLLLGSGTGNTIAPNNISNSPYASLAGDSCPASPSGNGAPARPVRRPRFAIVKP